MKNKAKDITNPDEAFELLGVNNPELPGGDKVETDENVGLPEEKEQVKEPQQEDTSVEEEVVEQKVSSTQNADGSLTEAETQRRTWQREADLAKKEKERLEEQLRLLQEQNKQLYSVVTPFMTKYGLDSQKVQQPDPDQEPEADFIEDGYFDPQKFKDYSKRRDQWLSTRLSSQIRDSLKKDQEQQTLQQQLAQVANEFPEYVNPLTGDVDVNRLQRDLASITSKKTIVDILKEGRGVKTNTVVDTSKSFEAIEKNANRPQSVASTSESEETKKEVPKEIKQLYETFGDIELPPNFGGIK